MRVLPKTTTWILKRETAALHPMKKKVFWSFGRSGGRAVGKDMLPAEASGKLRRGMLVVSVNGKVVLGKLFRETMVAIREATRPLSICFTNPHTEIAKRIDEEAGPRKSAKAVSASLAGHVPEHLSVSSPDVLPYVPGGQGCS
jgi:hypothetical protein